MVCCVYCDCLSHWDLGSKPNVGNSKLFPVRGTAVTRMLGNQSDSRYEIIIVSRMCDVRMERAMELACQRLGYTKLKDEQLRTVRDVLSGLDTFVSLPTGYGKSLCYAILPWAFDELRNTEKASIVLVVSPLGSLTTEQVRAYTPYSFFAY